MEEVMAVLDHPGFAAAFAPGSQAEAGLLAELPEFGKGARVNGRIDRLVVTDSQVLILDFKTNRPPPASEAEVPAVYLAQMALYRAAAARIFPGRRIICGTGVYRWAPAFTAFRCGSGPPDGRDFRPALTSRVCVPRYGGAIVQESKSCP